MPVKKTLQLIIYFKDQLKLSCVDGGDGGVRVCQGNGDFIVPQSVIRRWDKENNALYFIDDWELVCGKEALRLHFMVPGLHNIYIYIPHSKIKIKKIEIL